MYQLPSQPYYGSSPPQYYGGAPPVQTVIAPYTPVPGGKHAIPPGANVYSPAPGVYDYTMQGPAREQIEIPVLTTETVPGKYEWKQSTPIIVFIGLAIVALILTIFVPVRGQQKIWLLLGSILWIVIWGIFVVWAAKKGKMIVAWILVLVAMIIWIVFIILVWVHKIVIPRGDMVV